MFLEFFGPRRRAATLNLGDWKRFIRARRNGDTGPSGARRGRPVGDRQIQYDLKFLWSVLNWAATTGDGEGNLLLPGNPLKKYVRARHWPKEINPARPVLTESQYRALLEAAAVLRKARENNSAIGDSWVFPSPTDPSRPCSRNIMRDWWNAAQARAGLSHIERLGWHTLRRKFANDLRKFPLKDLAALGGWKDTRTILVCYLEEDEQAMVEALRNRRRHPPR